MKMLNTVKENNACIVLADGETSLGVAGGGLSYQEATGLLANGIKTMKDARMQVLQDQVDLLSPLFVPDGTKEATREKDEKKLSSPLGRSQFSSLLDVLAYRLGFVPPPIQGNGSQQQSPLLAASTSDVDGVLEASSQSPAIVSKEIIELLDDDEEDDDLLTTSFAVFSCQKGD